VDEECHVLDTPSAILGCMGVGGRSGELVIDWTASTLVGPSSGRISERAPLAAETGVTARKKGV
jgi:hypothetical protein